MKIALSTLSGISYGGLTFNMNLIPALSKMDKSNQYVIFSTNNGAHLSGINSKNIKCVNINRLSLNIYSFLRYYFTRISMIRANKIIVVSEY